jgi:hypothetical protein
MLATVVQAARSWESGGYPGLAEVEHFAGTKILLETNTPDSAESQ